jgi:hypothetical protein
MSTTTSRLGLYKTASDGSELVNVVTDLLNNWDKLDLNANYRDCTSTTRPSTVWAGLCIRESDTGRLYVSNGSAPASGSWKQIPAEGATFLAGLVLGSTLAVSGAVTLSSTLGVTGATSLNSTLAVTGAATFTTVRATSHAVAYTEDTSVRTSTSTSYVDVSTLSTTIVVPPSGKVQIVGYVNHYNNATSTSYSDLVVSGSVSGSLRAATDSRAMQTANFTSAGATVACCSLPVVITSANVGETLTVKFQHRVSGGTGQWSYRSITAIPLI